jgi:Flp pilus assembly protein TadG
MKRFFRTALRSFIAPAHRQGQKLARDNRGTTAIEFALLGVPFFAVLGATLESGITFMAAQALDSAVGDAGRLVMTGQAEANGFNAAMFRTAVCDRLFGLFDCSKIKIKVRVITDFASATTASPVYTSGPLTGQWKIVEDYDDGIGSSIIVAEAYYKWPTILNINGFTLQDQPDGTKLMSGVRVFRNEPFSGAP